MLLRGVSRCFTALFHGDSWCFMVFQGVSLLCFVLFHAVSRCFIALFHCCFKVFHYSASCCFKMFQCPVSSSFMTMKQVQWERAIMVVPDYSTVSRRDATRLNSSWTVGLSRSQWADWQCLVRFGWTQSRRDIDNQPDQSVQLDPIRPSRTRSEPVGDIF